MANITRIKAGDGSKKDDKTTKTSKPPVQKAVKTKNTSPKLQEATIKEAKIKTAKKPRGKFKNVIFWIFTLKFIWYPLILLGRYIKASAKELRQVRWPNRKYTFKMTFAVIFYTILIAGIVMALDLLFTFIFNNLILN